MKKVIILVVLVLSLTGCERIGEYIANKFAEIIPSSSLEQDQKAEQLYRALQQRNKTQVTALVGSSLQAELQANPALFEQIMQMVPSKEASSVSVISTIRSVNLGEGKTTKVVYSYQYPESVLQFTVVFQGVDNGTEIIGFHVNSSISSQQTDAENPDLADEASQPKLIEI